MNVGLTPNLYAPQARDTSTTGGTTGGTTSTGSAGSTGSSSSSQTGAPSQLASESVFLQLLVAQLKNQDPTSPADPTQFLAQLAQFSTLEQNTLERQDLDGILTQLKGLTAASTATGTGSTTGTGTNGSTTGQQNNNTSAVS